ncbi:3862_t:CDS:2 [Dentiscutata erythropus]|uniref:3862_t:CDS:1 n=1 Tax=Dentiscutata erythropus TaxID=1348616 RepID=A0A9N9NNB3_9GLOM|nr:3862_t:CDS:2 [Dentiscutata erythropus]
MSLPLEPPKSDEPISYNAIAQKEVFAKKKELEKELAELQAMSRIITNPEYYKSFSSQISDIEKNIKSQDIRLEKLKRHAAINKNVVEEEQDNKDNDENDELYVP